MISLSKKTLWTPQFRAPSSVDIDNCILGTEYCVARTASVVRAYFLGTFKYSENRGRGKSRGCERLKFPGKWLHEKCQESGTSFKVPTR